MIIAGNWKLNKSVKETISFLKELNTATKELDQQKFIVFPTQLSLMACAEQLKDSGIKWGCQNICTNSSGAFTGETSVEHIKELGAEYVLIGHSERRSLFHETNEETFVKLKLSLENKLMPILCVGETLAQREAGQTEEVLKKQIEQALKSIDSELVKNVIVAYEPVWAIGTGKVADAAQVKQTHQMIRKIYTSLFDDHLAKKLNILYGGSVKPQNCEELSEIEGVDGFLIGGASLKIESFTEIYKLSKK